EVNVQAEVTDANNQTLTSMASTVVHPASIYIGISRNDKLVRVGEQMPLKIVATDTHGAPFLQSVRVTATLTREVNSTVKSTTATGATTTRNEVTEEPVEMREVTIEPADSAKEGASFDFVPKANGRHFLTVRGTDSDGRAFATVIHFEVYGAHEYPWAYEDGLRIKMIAEKKSYKPGETARILVLSPIEGTALVTVERQEVQRSFQVELRADHPVVEVPLTDEDAPNAFVSVLIVKGAKESARKFKQPQLRLGYCELTVQNVKDTLAVDLQSSAPTYRPGDEASLVGKVTLANGQPASGAEVTLYAEDEGTLAVMGYETPRPMDYFFKPRTLDVETGMSFESFVPEDPELQQFNIKGYFVGGGGDFSKLADLLRKNFDPCATWAPAIIADARGRFAHKFKVPDTLTRYRIMAIAHHGASRFGQTEAVVVVKKQLMLEPKAPRFANQSDTVKTQVLVQNASAFSGTWEIQLRNGSASDGSCTSSVGPTTQRVSLAPGGSASLVFPIHADQTGEAVLTWLATPVALDGAKLTDSIRRDLTDFVECRFPVEYPMPLLRQTKLVRLDASGTKQDLRASLDPALLAGTGGVDVEFSRSLLLEAGSSIDYLLHYPYGCVEQTTSSLIPWLTVEELRPVVPSFAKVPKEKVAAAIQAGVDRLLSMQLPDGSFSYWPGGQDAVAWATAYAGMGLVMASEKGANVPPSAIEALTKRLTESLRGIADEKSSSALEGHTRALYVLALAHAPQPAYQNLLVDRIAELTPSARALLAAAIAAQDSQNPTHLAVAKSLLTSQVPLRLKSDDWMQWSPDDACRLIAWLATDPTSDEPTKALDRMFRERNPYGHWRTTWVNGWSLLAMAAYAKTEMVASESVTLQLVAAKGTETISLTRETPVAARSFTLAPDLKLELTSHQAAFVRLALASKPPIQPLQPVAKNGLSIDRIYERILANGSAEILTEPKVGDLIRVSLRVTLPKDGTRYLCIDDPLPAVFETVNSDFQSQRAAVGTPTSQSDWRVSHSELRSDRATFFLDEVRARGTYTLTYLVRCTLAGQAVAPPAKVESMYDPENFALSASRAFATE
ncbi:MAG: hypothetical protein ORN51_12480, partial [Akkermansiaceae bacterium]|nr:hypothetical protein [Akkermansiaceae bacterium]